MHSSFYWITTSFKSFWTLVSLSYWWCGVLHPVGRDSSIFSWGSLNIWLLWPLTAHMSLYFLTSISGTSMYSVNLHCIFYSHMTSLDKSCRGPISDGTIVDMVSKTQNELHSLTSLQNRTSEKSTKLPWFVLSGELEIWTAVWHANRIARIKTLQLYRASNGFPSNIERVIVCDK